MSNTHVDADSCAGRDVLHLWNWTSEAGKPSVRAILGDSGRYGGSYVAPFTTDAEFDPPTLGNEYLTPLAINVPDRQISYDKTLVDTGFAPVGRPK
jgi:hypothetical protein